MNKNSCELTQEQLEFPPGCPRICFTILQKTAHKEKTGRYDTLGYALAMRVLQSPLYAQLDDTERAQCDELIAIGQRRRVP